MARRRTCPRDRWIQCAIRRPGALRQWFQRNRKRLKRLLGYDPLNRDGTIKAKAITGVLRLHKEGRLRLDTTTVRRLNLAKTLRRLR